MGCLASKSTETGHTRRKALLLQARYGLPLWVLIKASDMTDEKVAEFKETFQKFANGGVIKASDVGPLMKATKHILDDKDIQNIMVQAGVSENDTVDFELFMKMVLGYARRNDPEVEMKDAFSVFDEDKNGVINSEEMRTVFSSLGSNLCDSEVAALIREADLDGDGLVDYNEFIRLLCNPGHETF